MALQVGFHTMTVSDSVLERGLANALGHTNYPELGERHQAKEVDSYLKDGKRTCVVTDRTAAFDMVLGTVPFKGQILNKLAQYWFETSSSVHPNHLLEVPDPAVRIVTECEPLKVDVVVRGFITGRSPLSLWSRYEAGDRVYGGQTLPEGLKRNQALPERFVTPILNPQFGGYAEPLTAEDAISRDILSEENWQQARAACVAMFDFGTQLAKKRGLLLVDARYKLGLDQEGQLVFTHEIHGPASANYWYADSYQAASADDSADPIALNQDPVSRYLTEQDIVGTTLVPGLPPEVCFEAARNHLEMYEVVTGQEFVPDTEEPDARIRRNLRLA